MAKTIWYISKYFAPPAENNVGSRGWLLLKEFVNKGYRPVVITSDSNNLVELPKLSKSVTVDEVEGVKIVWLKTLKYTVAKSVNRILSWLHFEWNLFWLNENKLPKPDVVIVSSLSLLTILNGIRFKRRFNCKLVFEIRDIWPLTIVEEGGFSSKNLFVKTLGWVERVGYEKADVIVGTMPNLRQHVKEVLGYDKPVECIPMGVTDEMFSTDILIANDYINTYLNRDYFNIVYAGTVGITNALETFFKAAEVLKDNKKIRFVIVGDGPLKGKFIKQYGHFPNLVFAPKVDKNQVYSVLSNADLVYFSTYKSKVWDYGQSLNKVIDYMLSGKPVLASYSGYPSMINEAECGFFVSAEDVCALVEKILVIMEMPESERLNIGAKGRAWLLENRGYAKLADDYLSFMFDQ